MAAVSKEAVPIDTSSWKGLARTFVGIILSKNYGRVLLSIWSSFLVTSLLVLPVTNALTRQRQKGRNDNATDTQGRKKTAPRRSALSTLLDILMRFRFTKHGGFVLAYIATLCTRVLITVRLADMGGELGSFMGARNWEAMFLGQGRLGLWFMVGAFATAVMKFLEKRVTLSVREVLYKTFLGQYMDKENLLYYHSGVPDAPARFTSDIDEFSAVSVRTLGHILKPVIDIVYLSYTIGQRIGFSSLAIFLSFFGVAQHMIGNVKNALPRSLKRLALQKQELEAELRTHHEQLHQFREQVALQDGTLKEMQALEKRHARLVRHQVLTSYIFAVVDVLNTYVLKYGGAMCAFSVLIPEVFLGDPKVPGSKITAHYLTNVTLLQTLATEIKDLAEALTDASRVRGIADRLVQLKDKMEAARPGGADRKPDGAVRTVTDDDHIRISNLTVVPPRREGQEGESRPLVSGLTLAVNKGEHLVIRGPNGVGKTSFFRTLCGLWGAEPGASIQLPGSKNAVFAVSQDGYFPGGVTLRGQIAYPNEAERVPVAEALELLGAVGLEGMDDHLDKEGVDWRIRLSGGQKQRLSWARMLHHKPTFALVDEGTSQVDQKGCKLLHGAAKEKGITLVSISHHATVDTHHDVTLDFLGGGDGWYKTGKMEDQ